MGPGMEAGEFYDCTVELRLGICCTRRGGLLVDRDWRLYRYEDLAALNRTQVVIRSECRVRFKCFRTEIRVG